MKRTGAAIGKTVALTLAVDRWWCQRIDLWLVLGKLQRWSSQSNLQQLSQSCKHQGFQLHCMTARSFFTWATTPRHNSHPSHIFSWIHYHIYNPSMKAPQLRTIWSEKLLVSVCINLCLYVLFNYSLSGSADRTKQRLFLKTLIVDKFAQFAKHLAIRYWQRFCADSAQNWHPKSELDNTSRFAILSAHPICVVNPTSSLCRNIFHYFIEEN